MANPQLDCPTQNDLSQFLSGDLAEHSIEIIASHLETCKTCRQRMETLDQSDDSLLRNLRTSKGGDSFADEPQFQRVAARATPGQEIDPTVSISLSETAPQIGQYRLVAKLGEGGMGAVYKAEHVKLKKLVALKVLPNARLQDPQAVSRFEREMQAVGKLEHENIVRASDAGEVGGVHYLAMELVEGTDLSALSKQMGPLAVAEACEIVRQASRGLHCAHQNGIVHRDIKPSNLMLTRQGQVKILDLGLALLEETHLSVGGGELTGSGQLMGTLDYMAPEQCGDSHKVDARADIYSLGATLYKLLCGEAPFAGNPYSKVISKVMAIAHQEPPSILDRRADLPPDLLAVLNKMMAKSPDARYATAEEVDQALLPFTHESRLSHLLADERVTARMQKQQAQASLSTDAHFASAMVTETPHMVAPAPVARPATMPAGSKAGKPPWIIACGLLTVLAVLGVLGAIFYFQTPDGTVRIELTDPDLQLRIKGQDLLVQGKDQKTIKLTPGKHILEIQWGEVKFETDKFILRDGKDVVLRVEYLPGSVKVVQNGKVIDERAVEQVASAQEPPSKDPLADGLITPDEGWVDLLPTIRPAEDAVYGKVAIDGNGLKIIQFHEGEYCNGVMLFGTPIQLIGSYRLRINFECLRSTHPHLIGLTLPIAGNRVALIVPSSSSEMSRPKGLLHTVKGELLYGREIPPTVLTDTNYELIVDVREMPKGSAAISATINGFEALTWMGKIEDLHIKSSSAWARVPAGRIGVYTAFHKLIIHNLDLQMLDGKAWLMRPAEAAISGATSVDATDQHVWPPDAPPPAIAPFDAAAATTHQQAWADYLGVPVERDVELPGGEKLTMVLIPPGEFMMGSTDEEQKYVLEHVISETAPDSPARSMLPTEVPQHRVRITPPFYLGKYEVTQAQWQAVMEENPSKFDDDPNRPVEQLNWDDIQPFLTKINQTSAREELAFVLPTEAQWEYACRAGTTTIWHFGNSEQALPAYAWFSKNSEQQSHPVGGLRPNPFGLYDMYGNVSEWCADFYADDYYANSPTDDPHGPTTGRNHVTRGENWVGSPGRSATRGNNRLAYPWFGFRLAAALTGDTKGAPPDASARSRNTPVPVDAFVLLNASGTELNRFPTLAEAVLGASDGDIIEIRGDGPFATDQIIIENRALTIRAGQGFRPVLRMSGHRTRPENSPGWTDSMLSTNAPLVLEGIVFERLNMTTEDHINVPKIVFTRGSGVYLANCRFRVEGFASCVQAHSSKCDCVVRNCEFLCPGMWSHAVSSAIYLRSRTMENCIHLGGQVQSNHGSAGVGQGEEIRLANNTMVCEGQWTGIVGLHVPELPPASPIVPTRIQASGNIVDSVNSLYFTGMPAWEDNAPWLTTEEWERFLRRMVNWEDHDNVYADGRCRARFWPENVKWPSISRVTAWKQFWKQPDASILEGTIRYQGGDLLARLKTDPASITPDDFRLRPDSAGYQAGPDGKDLGADIDFVGPGEAYERWKQTPEYAEWKKEIAQIMQGGDSSSD